MDVSIVISERGEPHNLVWTLQGLENDLSGSGIKYEYVIVVNGDADKNPLDSDHTYQWLKKKWPWLGGFACLAYNSPGGIYQARNLGADMAKGDQLWFLDAHCLPVPGHFAKAFQFKRTFRGVYHMGLRYFLDKPNRQVYGYTWKPDSFWGAWNRTPPVPPDYRILMNGGACLIIDHDIWDEIGGYNKGLGIYGGGEPYTDIKAQMYGYQVKSRPDTLYYHLATTRGYHWFQTDMWKNFMITAFALGGDKYLDRVYASYFEKCKHNADWLATLNGARDEAMRWAVPDHEKTMREAKFTVDEVLASWRAYAVANGHEVGEWPG